MNVSHNFERFFRIDKLHPPRNFNKPQNTSHPIHLEIGAGKGKHALWFAESNPKETLFAVERTKEKFSAFSKQAIDRQLDNLRPIHADVIPWSVFSLQPNTLKSVFILYPNPERNNPNQRWLRMPYFEFLLSRMQNDACITLATNIQTYVEESLQLSESIWKLPSELAKVKQDSARTHFEIKYLARGETCWQLDIKKPSGYVTRFDDFKHV